MGDVTIGQNEKGKCLLATRDIGKGAYICKYEGELLGYGEGLKRFQSYQSELGSYMIDFKLDGTTFWLDATVSYLQSVGRCINHSHKNPNVKGVCKRVNGDPMVYFEAIKAIPRGTEILWDYKDRCCEAQAAFPFLKE